MNKLDFIILTLPRSGSHMLASALDSHPDICCKGELFRPGPPLYDWLGDVPKKINGGIVLLRWAEKALAEGAPKVICLTRNPERLAQYLQYGIQGDMHYYEAAAAQSQPKPDAEFITQATARVERIKSIARQHSALMLDYDEITGNRDVRELPQEITWKLCDFLSVERHSMTPKFYKPIMETA